MFWSLLTSTKATGLVDVVRLCTETSTGVHHDSMDPVLEQPGYDIGSAVCTRGEIINISLLEVHTEMHCGILSF